MWRHHGLWSVAAALLVGALSGSATSWSMVRDGFERAAPAEAPIAVSWPEALSSRETAELLVDLRLAADRRATELYLDLTDGVECVIPGPHLLPARATLAEVMAALCRDPIRPRAKVVIPEGFHRFAIAGRLEKAGIVAAPAFLRVTADRPFLHRLDVDPAEHPAGDTAEGYLFPATYHFPIDADPEAVAKRLVVESLRRVDRAIERHPEAWRLLQEELDFDRRALLTLASMVEKETGAPEERPLIASVFLNRLRDPRFPHLQSDPTAMYGCHAMPEAIPACEGFEGRASGALNRDRTNVFSTYVTPGLPPGPIANPGEASIEAVLAPEDTAFRFFVAKGAGRHTFSETLAEHDEAVDALRRRRNAP